MGSLSAERPLLCRRIKSRNYPTFFSRIKENEPSRCFLRVPESSCYFLQKRSLSLILVSHRRRTGVTPHHHHHHRHYSRVSSFSFRSSISLDLSSRKNSDESLNPLRSGRARERDALLKPRNVISLRDLNASAERFFIPRSARCV